MEGDYKVLLRRRRKGDVLRRVKIGKPRMTNCFIFAFFILLRRRCRTTAIYLRLQDDYTPHILVELNMKRIVHITTTRNREVLPPLYFEGIVEVMRPELLIRRKGLFRFEPYYVGSQCHRKCVTTKCSP